MNYRKFGNTDLEVSEICFGPMRFAAKEAAEDEVSASGKRALERALERGVNFIHSSYEYRTRWALGRVLKDHPKRHDLHHIIKVPVPDRPDGGRFDPDCDRPGVHGQDFLVRVLNPKLEQELVAAGDVLRQLMFKELDGIEIFKGSDPCLPLVQRDLDLVVPAFRQSQVDSRLISQVFAGEIHFLES